LLPSPSYMYARAQHNVPSFLSGQCRAPTSIWRTTGARRSHARTPATHAATHAPSRTHASHARTFRLHRRPAPSALHRGRDSLFFVPLYRCDHLPPSARTRPVTQGDPANIAALNRRYLDAAYLTYRSPSCSTFADSLLSLYPSSSSTPPPSPSPLPHSPLSLYTHGRPRTRNAGPIRPPCAPPSWRRKSADLGTAGPDHEGQVHAGELLGRSHGVG